MAQLNFSGPWEKMSILWQYLSLQLNKTLPYLTNLAYFFPNHARSIHPNTAGGHLTLPLTNILYFFRIEEVARWFLKTSQILIMFDFICFCGLVHRWVGPTHRMAWGDGKQVYERNQQQLSITDRRDSRETRKGEILKYMIAKKLSY